MKNKKGFTLVELLAVIVILGLLMAIAIPSVTKYITQSRKKTLATSIHAYIDAVITQVNEGEYKFTDSTKIFAVPIECIPLEKGGTDPFGEWIQSNDEYWAYVLVQYDNINYNYLYGFTFKDSAGYGMYPLTTTKMSSNGKEIATDLFLARPKTGLPTLMATTKRWENSGFNVDENTRMNVLTSSRWGKKGDGQAYCTLERKGDNYEQVLSKVNTDYGNFGPITEEDESDLNFCNSFQGCYGGNDGELEYDSQGALILDEDNPVAIIPSSESREITDNYSVHLTIKANTNQSPKGGSFAGTIVSVAGQTQGNYLVWIGVYKNHLHVYSFTGSPQSGVNYPLKKTGFISIDISEYNNKIFNVQVTGTYNKKTKVYINGEYKDEFDSGNKRITVAQTIIGDLRQNRNLKFTGTLYEIEIYNRIISDDEIKANYEHSKNAWGI